VIPPNKEGKQAQKSSSFAKICCPNWLIYMGVLKSWQKSNLALIIIIFKINFQCFSRIISMTNLILKNYENYLKVLYVFLI